MDEAMSEQRIREGKIFRVGESFLFAVQVPDRSVGISGSRCSNCGVSAAFVDQMCDGCGLPLVGPTCLPEYNEWTSLSPEAKKNAANNVYHFHRHGRLGYANVADIPLTPRELSSVETLGQKEAAVFNQAHKVSTRQIRGLLVRYIP